MLEKIGSFTRNESSTARVETRVGRILPILVTALAPFALCFEPFARYPRNLPSAWLGVIAVVPLAVVALRRRDRWISVVALGHAFWLVGAYLSFSTVGEIWCALQLVLCGASALVCTGVSIALRSSAQLADSTRYGLVLLLVLGGAFALISATRGMWDGATWAFIHHEAEGLIRHVRTTGDPAGYEADVGWAHAALRHRARECDDGTTGHVVLYSVASSGTHHSFNTCPDQGTWFYYPD